MNIDNINERLTDAATMTMELSVDHSGYFDWFAVGAFSDEHDFGYAFNIDSDGSVDMYEAIELAVPTIEEFLFDIARGVNIDSDFKMSAYATIMHYRTK